MKQQYSQNDILYDSMKELLFRNFSISPDQILSDVPFFSSESLMDNGVFPDNLLGYVTLKKHKIKFHKIISEFVNKNDEHFPIYQNLEHAKILGYLPIEDGYLAVVKQRKSKLIPISFLIATIYTFYYYIMLFK